jgi:CubicO group peptidase (beta-lactamase class C family)
MQLWSSTRPNVTGFAALTVLVSGAVWAGPAQRYFPRDEMLSDRPLGRPVSNAAFAPAGDAAKADPLHATVSIHQTALMLDRELSQPVCDGRKVELGGSCRGGADKRVFPAIAVELFTFEDNSMLGSPEVGTMIAEKDADSDKESYWHVIPQYGRVWKEPGDGDWSRAALPIMLVHDFENVAHHGLATFLYKGNAVSDIRMQFVQQSTPWNTPEHFVAWGVAEAELHDIVNPTRLAEQQAAASIEIGQRTAVRPWSELVEQYPPGALDGFGGPLNERWIVMQAVVKDGIVYRKEPETPYGPFPYPQEMRFGIRSMTKSITAPLTLARLSQVFGPYVLNLKIGDYVDGLHPAYGEVRFIDAANMATGMGGAGTPTTNPNDGESGYVDATYDDWYNGARSAKEKVEYITRDTRPYPWGPGVVFRYNDRDYHLLGMAANGFLKAMRGPEANVWDMLEDEVFRPIAIYHAPIIKTIESDGTKRLPWFHAGFYASLDDIVKIALLYQNRGRFGETPILHPDVTAQIFTTEGALIKDRDHSLEAAFSIDVDESKYKGKELYKFGYHYLPYTDDQGAERHVPAMSGFSGTQAIFHANGIISIRFAKAWPLPSDEQGDVNRHDTIDIIGRLP